MRGARRADVTAAVVVVTALLVAACGAVGSAPPEVAQSSAAERAARRAFDGAPPVVPHGPLGASCNSCHDADGAAIPGLGWAPASPHGPLAAARIGTLARCAQCHVTRLDSAAAAVFVASDFRGRAQDLRPGTRLYPGAPPVLPHPVLLRERCAACHAGPAARAEIRTSHPERVNCRQCHLEHRTDDVFRSRW